MAFNWNAIGDFKRDVRGPWVKCSDWLTQQKKLAKKDPEQKALVDEARLILSMLPWGWGKPRGLSDSEPCFKLWRFLGTHWLSGSQQNDMLELLRHKVDSDPLLAQNIRVQGVDRNAQSFRWLRDLADDLVRNQAALVTTAHLGEITNEPHWIGLVVDLSLPTTKILYGDSFGHPIPPTLLDACRWWISQHTEAHLALDKLPVGPQDDGFSCGMLVDNSLQHFVNPEIPLSKPGGKFVSARLTAFNKIGQWVLERVSFACLYLRLF
ncbi:hypothetical protein FB451DRAFT_1213490 [Mycena latifolia]|nr:hypothetical protein FB451DRAFT_1250049 [Mycena latifolia]KAJ7495162.1 hypothetical protein FB451DRAFT_1213490 [Mycena latifolia]